MSDDAHGLPDPDRNRYTGSVRSRAGGGPLQPVGDPTRWGAVGSVVALGAGQVFQSPQFLRVQASDNYSRTWTMLGTVNASDIQWASVYARIGSNFAVGDWALGLEVIQGVGQARITQMYDLRLLTTIGLNVYGVTRERAGVRETRAFAIAGGIVGQAIDVRIVAQNQNAFGGQNDPIVVTAILAPMAAGTGI